jgi:hypothetical protein
MERPPRESHATSGSTGVLVDVALGLGVGVGLTVGVGLAVGVSLGIAVRVAVAVGVAVRVGVGEALGVDGSVLVAVLVGEGSGAAPSSSEHAATKRTQARRRLAARGLMTFVQPRWAVIPSRD